MILASGARGPGFNSRRSPFRPSRRPRISGDSLTSYICDINPSNESRCILMKRGHGAMAARLTPDQKVGSSNLSAVIFDCRKSRLQNCMRSNRKHYDLPSAGVTLVLLKRRGQVKSCAALPNTEQPGAPTPSQIWKTCTVAPPKFRHPNR